MIKISAIGFLGKDCNVNTVNGKTVINFSVAHTEKFKNAQGVQTEKTTWINCAYWVERPALAQYLVKGMQIYIEGQPEVSTYQAQDREWRAELKCRVIHVQLLGSANQRSAGQQSGGNVPASNPHTDIPQEGFDEVPF